MSSVTPKHCETCGDVFASRGRVCADCLREEEIKPAADAWQLQFHSGIDTEALQQLEFIMTKCALCEQYYGPYSMEKHLQEDHALVDEREVYRSAYKTGRADGQSEGYRAGYEDADPEDF
jgi:hypothetical protein